MKAPPLDDFSVLKFVLFAKFFNNLIYVRLTSHNLRRSGHNICTKPTRVFADDEIDATNIDAPLYYIFEF